MTDEAIASLKGLPCLFMSEEDVTDSRVGYIEEITPKSDTIEVKYHFDPIFPAISSGEIEKLTRQLDIETPLSYTGLIGP